MIELRSGHRHLRRGHAAGAPRASSLRIDEGELCLVIGPTGSGKSTLLGAINGLVPHFTGGQLRGPGHRRRARHADAPAARARRRRRRRRPGPARRLRDRHGRGGARLRDGAAGRAAGRDAQAGRGDARPARHRRAARAGRCATLSGGQQQRVAIGSVLTAHPRVLVLDEPTSALDPTAAEEVLAAITRLVHDLGITVVLAEHRLERVVQYADRVVQLARRRQRALRRARRRAGRSPRRPAGGRPRPAGRLGSAAAVGARRPPAGAGAPRAPRGSAGPRRAAPATGPARPALRTGIVGPLRRDGRRARGRPRRCAPERSSR